MDNILIIEYKNLKYLLYNHFSIFSIITLLNIIFFILIYFKNKVYEAFYLIGTIIYFLMILIPIYPLCILKQNLFKEKSKFLIKISNYVFCAIIFSGFLVNLMAFLNIGELYSFYINCPYNFSYNDITKIFNINYNTDKEKNINFSYSDKCLDRRCLFVKENFEDNIFFTYLCNFDSSYDLYNNSINNNKFKTRNKSIICKIFNETDFDDGIFLDKKEEDIFIIRAYYKICSFKHLFYKCDIYNKPKEYKLNYNYSCPKNSNEIVLILVAVISIIFNILIALIISLLISLKYKRIMAIYQNIHNNPEICSTRNSTKSVSERKPNPNDGNITPETLIVGSNTIRKEENEETKNDKNISISVIQNDGVLSIKNLNNDYIRKDSQINVIDKSESKNINLVNNIYTRNETTDN